MNFLSFWNVKDFVYMLMYEGDSVKRRRIVLVNNILLENSKELK